MSTFECKYCFKKLSSKSSLDKHLSNAKYCINKRLDISDVKNIFQCKCKKTFTSNQSLKLHGIKCFETITQEHNDHILKISREHNEYILKLQVNFENEINKKDVLIRELQHTIENLAVKAINRPTTTNTTNTTNNTNIMNLAPLDMNILTERVTKVINEKMTSSHLIDGQEGVARLIASCFMNEDGKKLITCTDTSRGIWKSKDKDGNVIKDYKANNIARVVKPIAVLKADKIIELDDDKRSKLSELRQIRERYKNFDSMNEIDRKHMMGHKKDSLTYKSMLNVIEKRCAQHSLDKQREEQIENEYDFSSFFLEEEDTENKMRIGKNDLIMLSQDSSKFSNGLLMKV